MSKQTSGPAFPHTDDMVSGGNDRAGLTIRDYFAAKAMQGHLASNPGFLPENVARWAYEYADFMLAERAEEK